MNTKQIRKWQPDDFELEITSTWSFPDRGDWATHDGDYRGNWSPYVPRNLILRYSSEGDLILDQFSGGGTSLIEAKLLNRNIIGIDINQSALKICKEKTSFNYELSSSEVYLKEGDARHLTCIRDESIDLICTHPPYADIIKYDENNKRDLSNLSYIDFIKEMKKVANESFRVLKKGKYCCILIGDIRQKGKVLPLAFRIMDTFLSSGFELKEIILKKQHNCKTTGYWEKRCLKYNFYLLAHEYLFVFRKG